MEFSSNVMSVTNIAAYHFVNLHNLENWKQAVTQETNDRGLKGTVLLSAEGINLFLAGTQSGIEGFVHWLKGQPELTDLEVKYSESDSVPFKRLKIKIKNEIIRMNHPTIQPQQGRAPAVDALTAKRWIAQGHDDQGRPVVLLDTRNEFEVQAGTFKGAISWQLSRFTEFPEAVRAHVDALQEKTVISFCTGGIRCEKAAIYMRAIGLEHVYQLDGGILKYFEQAGGAGFEGTCFVFDERETLDPALRPAPLPQ